MGVGCRPVGQFCGCGLSGGVSGSYWVEGNVYYSGSKLGRQSQGVVVNVIVVAQNAVGSGEAGLVQVPTN